MTIEVKTVNTRFVKVSIPYQNEFASNGLAVHKFLDGVLERQKLTIDVLR